jgi:uncharacterized protein YbjQ (UPF0145 family)
MSNDEILLSTQDHPVGYTITETLGLVRGNTVRSRNIGRNFLAGLKTIVGGEITQWTKAVEESRDQALARLVEHAKAQGANAVVGLRFITSEVGQAASEILVYGTGVKVTKS